MSKSNELIKHLKRLDAAFELDEIIQQDFDLREIEEYYFQSNPGYLLLHSAQGAVHMALSPPDKYRPEDYIKQVNFVAEEIKCLNVRKVLEIGSGKGFNLYHLAKTFPQQRFLGLDFSALHVRQSRKKLKSLPNATTIRADFHHIPAGGKTFDYVFEFESICHALDIKQVLQSVHDVLKPGGYFRLFDGFRVLPMHKLNDDETLARRLIEKTLGVQEGILVEDFISFAQDAGFEVIKSDNLSKNILANLNHIQSVQNILFPHPLLLRFGNAIFPKYFIRNVIAGMLMPYMVEEGIQGYYRITLKRK